MSAGSTWISAAVAPMHAQPRISSEQTSQLLRGDICILAGVEGDWLRLAGADGYEGWVHRGYTGGGISGGAESGPSPLAVSCGCTVESAGRALPLPFGASVLEGDVVLSGESVPLELLASAFPRTAESLKATVLNHFSGTPYLWGGVTPWGADCSGMVQRVLAAHGLQLPRDSAMQAAAGTPSRSTPEQSIAGELLFFTDRDDGRITHVGLSLGGSRMAHVALGRGGFTTEDFAAQSPLGDSYAESLARRFVTARRVI